MDRSLLLTIWLPMFVACSPAPPSIEDATVIDSGVSPAAGASNGGATERGAGGSRAALAVGEGSGRGSGASGGMVDLGSNGKLDIYPIGDSITLGTNGGYRNVVFTKLMADGYDVDMLGSLNDQWTSAADKDHEGHGGMGTGAILENLDAWMAHLPDPDLVLLMIGTNELAWDYGRPAMEAVGRLDTIIDKLFEAQPTVTVIVGSIPPLTPKEVLIDTKPVQRADAVNAYNALAKARVKERARAGERIAFAEVNRALSVADLVDGVHPTPEGYVKVGNAFYEAARSALSTPQVVISLAERD